MDPERLLGSLLQGALTGRSGKKMAKGLGGTLGRVATSRQGLTILGGLAIAAIEHVRSSQAKPATTPQPLPPPLPASPPTGDPGAHTPTYAASTPPPLPPPPPTPSDPRATLLIRAMVAAARADGTLDADERARIVQRVAEGGAGAEEARWLETEMASPIDLDSLVLSVETPVARAEIYLASLLAIDADTAAERAYLTLLAARLGLDDETVRQLELEVDRLRAESATERRES